MKFTILCGKFKYLYFSDFSNAGNVLENSAMNFKQASNDQQQPEFPVQTVEPEEMNKPEKYNKSDTLQQQNNADIDQPLNHSNQLVKTENSSELLQQMNSTEHQQLNNSSMLIYSLCIGFNLLN